jgi:RNA polymerase sigma-70 factor (ECF subfamily)
LTEEAAERGLVDAACAGDEAAFARLVDGARPRLVRHLGVTAADPDEPEEVAQETLARAWKALSGFDGRSRFYTWLFGIAHHVRLDRRRARRRRIEAAGEVPVEEAAAPPAREPGPLSRLLEVERRERLRDALDRLPERQRLALLLRFVDGLSCVEIGEALETTANGASMLIFRAKAELAELLPAEWFGRWRQP